MSQMENAVLSLKTAITQDITVKRDIIFTGLLENVQVNQIPENIFVRYFLPRFTGQIQDQDWLVKWISIAGTPMAEVAVIDDVGRQELFRVPAVLYTRNLLLKNNTVNMFDIFGRYEQIKKNIPQSATSFLFQALNAKKQELQQDYNSDKVQQTWYEILSRYNLLTSPQQTTQSNSISEKDVDDFFAF